MNSSNRVSNIAPASSIAIGSSRANCSRGAITTHGYSSTLGRSSIAIGSMRSYGGSIAIGSMSGDRSSVCMSSIAMS